ncbi:stage II sporulation protein P [Desulfofundulus thermobenzoicus]|uniref:Stage II sporulation protein P n=1 Tax=Desulfofundulus thermobenzoicus TaxID=29376 RepID=A0A6N7IRA9_9FIRM|nr:stage II sporulation protein P [Desulfofundulus thermobenzoicus]MQL51678.1 stage II sporulation protein P [Desulfofundulus thermobenzoicus]HHW45183.1 stage II sporulation protein P [Desulfotomaculum sp.]
MYRSLYRSNPWMVRQKIYHIIFIGAALFGIVSVVSGMAFFVFRPGGNVFLLRDPRVWLRMAMPAVAPDGGDENEIPGLSSAVWRNVTALFPLPLGDPRAILRSQLSLLTLAENATMPEAPEERYAGNNNSPPPAGASGDYLVAIYHTHTGETYALTDGTDRLEGKEGGVVQVGEAVARVLESKYGLPTLHITKVHDASYNLAYMESEKTVREILQQNSRIKVLLDIHRDAGKPRRDCLVKVNGQEMAPILFVVGSDARAPFTSWRENEQFARQLAAALDKKYPGLCQGVRVKEGRYNQFLHPRALLVEVGSANNSTAEALGSARLFADVLGEEIRRLVAEEKNPITHPGNQL